MKNKLIKTSSYVLSMLLSILGFSSCTNIEDAPCMYGVPSASFAISGKVTDSENNPIKGIQISTKSQIAESNSDGSYSLDVTNGFPTDLTIKFKDIDGTENGSYETKEVLEEFDSSDFVGGDDWDSGTATRTVNVTLTEKNND